MENKHINDSICLQCTGMDGSLLPDHSSLYITTTSFFKLEILHLLMNHYNLISQIPWNAVLSFFYIYIYIIRKMLQNKIKTQFSFKWAFKTNYIASVLSPHREQKGFSVCCDNIYRSSFICLFRPPLTMIHAVSVCIFLQWQMLDINPLRRYRPQIKAKA